MVIGAFECGVEAPRERVLLDLTVPLVGHELLEPLGKTSKFGSRKTGNKGFKFFNAHGQRISSVLIPGKKRLLRLSGRNEAPDFRL